MKLPTCLAAILALLLVSGCSTMDIYGHYQIAKSKLFLSAMRPGNYFKDDNRLALVKAARRCDAGKVQTLIEAGADPDAVGEEAMTPLAWMVVKQNYRGLECLLEAGATPDLQVEEERGGQRMYVSALSFSVAMPDKRYMTSLLEHGADPSLSISPVTGTPVVYDAILAGWQ
ncbi:MAG: ankyrin repeat domain-containing protein [Alcanivorax sp.]|nr:ankyrin repeat domain-containing protein [Alcanivorax sp.]